MKLSAPIYRLKREAKLLSDKAKIPHSEALDRIAKREGFSSWSLLIGKVGKASPAAKLYAQLIPGDLVLLAARPGQGKTLMSLELAVEAMKGGGHSAFFSLEYTARDVLARFRDLDVDVSKFKGRFEFDDSDEISADYMVERLKGARKKTVVIIDYLQLLDQRRDKPPLTDQIQSLKAFANDNDLILVFISQIDRSFDPTKKPLPDLEDVRLPNPVDLKLFTKTCFLNDGQIHFETSP